MNVKRDGHIHSHYCPHGSNDSFESYIKKAIEEEIEEITFTEHMPMPKGIVLEGASSDFLETSSPGIEEINEYFKEANYYKEKYKDATHNCVAYLVGTKERANDDGEPSGTAGLPMLKCFKKQELSNIIAIVTRYFGGIKLGLEV